MAELSNLVDALSINDKSCTTEELRLDENLRKSLIHIKNNYESVFSWEIRERTEKNQNLLAEFINITQEKYDLIAERDDEFNLNR